MASSARVRVSGNVAGPGSTQINNVNLNSTYTTDDLDRVCLQTLRCPNTLDVKIRLKEKDKLQHKSIEWVIQDEQYTKWLKSQDVSLLWIKGGAGKGKTMMSIGLIEQLEQPERPDEEPPIMAYFFCQNTNYELNTIESILKGLILRLVKRQQELCAVLRLHWDADKKSFQEDLSSWRALWVIFLEMLHRCEKPRIYVVIDALDECQGDDMPAFLQLIVNTGFSSKVKWLLTSRPLDSAGRELLSAPDQVMVSLELNSGHVSNAVSSYIAEKVVWLDHRNCYGPALCKQLIADLTMKAEDTYLWVSLVCKRLDGVSPAEVWTTIDKLPPGLTPLYHRIFEQLREGKQDDVENSMRLLKVMLLVFRPLREAEVSSVTGLELNKDAIARLVNRCASFVTKRGARIEFVHQSARDFLALEVQDSLNSHGSWGHGEIALSCLSSLSQQLKMNLLRLPRYDSESQPTEMLPDTLESGVLANINYAATLWVQHFSNAVSNDLTVAALGDHGEILTFLRAKMLEWFECLSLLGRLRDAFVALRLLSNKIDPKSCVAIFVKDATHLLTRHFSVVRIWPLQVYSSAVVFSPQESVVRRANLCKIPKWLKAFPRSETPWTSLVQTLAGHPDVVSFVTYSPDGKYIASGSRDQTVKLWDTTTGLNKETLRFDSVPVAIAFSPDSRYMLSGSEDGTIRIEDFLTGHRQRISNAHTDMIQAVAASKQHIASGSKDRTVMLWDIATGSHWKTLRGHSGSVRTVSFSPDGVSVASGSDDQTVIVWNTMTGNNEKILRGHSEWVNVVVFSPDGKLIVSSGLGGNVVVWAATTGQVQWTCKTSGSFGHVAFLPDTKWMVSESRSYVHLLNVMTGIRQKSIRIDGQCCHVAASPDGRHIATCGYDEFIHLWDLMVDDYRETSTKRHKRIVRAVAFSPDGDHVASCGDETIKLWDVATNHCKLFKGHLKRVCCVAFSPDGRYIASGGEDLTAKIWDLATGLLKTFDHLGPVETVAFSPNGKYIAWGDISGTIKLWDTATGQHKSLEGLLYGVEAVTFSPDSNYIASSFGSGIKLWDLRDDYKKTLRSDINSVFTVAFSPDGKQFAAGGYHSISLWHISEAPRPPKFFGHIFNSHLKFRYWRKIKTAEPAISYLRFSGDSVTLITNGGAFPVSDTIPDAPDRSSRPLQELFVRARPYLTASRPLWLHYGTTRLLRMASDFEMRCQASHGDKVAIGMYDGNVLIFEIDRKMVEEELRSQKLCFR